MGYFVDNKGKKKNIVVIIVAWRNVSGSNDLEVFNTISNLYAQIYQKYGTNAFEENILGVQPPECPKSHQ